MKQKQNFQYSLNQQEIESNSLSFEQFVQHNKDQIKKWNDYRPNLKKLYDLDPSKNKVSLQSFISDKSLEFIESMGFSNLRKITAHNLIKIYNTAPEMFQETLESYINIYTSNPDKLDNKILSFNADVYEIFPQLLQLKEELKEPKLTFEKFVEYNKDQINKWSEHRLDLEKLYDLDPSKKKRNFQYFISDESLQLVKSNIFYRNFPNTLRETYQINPVNFKQNRAIYEKDLERVYDVMTDEYFITDLYKMFPDHVTSQRNDRNVLFSKETLIVINSGIRPEIISSAYKASDPNTDQFKKFVSDDSISVLKLRLINPEELLKLFLENPSGYQIPKISNIFCNKIIEIIEEKKQNDSGIDEVINAIKYSTFNTLNSVVHNTAKLEKAVDVFARSCIDTGLKHKSGEGLSLKNKFIGLFKELVKSLDIKELHHIDFEIDNVIPNNVVAQSETFVENNHNVDQVAETFAERFNAERSTAKDKNQCVIM